MVDKLIFRRLSDKKEIDLIPYVKARLAESNDIKLYIGTDSQNVKRKTIFAVVIVFHYGNNGGHVIYSKVTEPRYRDVKQAFQKLWREVEYSVDLARYMESHNIKKPDYIDLDLSPDPRWRSNETLRSALGYVEGMGYVPRHKPDAIAASCVADKICR